MRTARTRLGEPARFLLSGALNTALTFVVYLGLLRVAPYPIAYSLAFGLGICLAYALNRFYVFRSGGGIGAIVLLALVYVLQLIIGLLVVFAWVDLLGLAEAFASISAVIVTVPITFLLSRRIFARDRESPVGADAGSGPCDPARDPCPPVARTRRTPR